MDFIISNASEYKFQSNIFGSFVNKGSAGGKCTSKSGIKPL